METGTPLRSVLRDIVGKVTTDELAVHLGISANGVAKIRKRHRLGIKAYGLVWFSPEDIAVAEAHCRTYRTRNQ